MSNSVATFGQSEILNTLTFIRVAVALKHVPTTTSLLTVGKTTSTRIIMPNIYRPTNELKRAREREKGKR